MITVDDIILAASDITCPNDIGILIKEVMQIFQSFCQDDRDSINFAIWFAEQRVMPRVIH